ncbi:helix-turn-helix transcriptional regulator [Glutamicibacter sp.]
MLLDKLGKFTQGYRDRVAIVTGGSGLGKSWVLEQIGQRLDGHPHRLIRSGKHDSAWPLSGLLSFISAVPLKLSPAVSGLFPDSTDSVVDRYRIAMALLPELTEKIEPDTVFLIDDLDFMDPDSQRILGFLASRLQGNRVSFIATITSATAPEPFDVFQRFQLEIVDSLTLKQMAIEESVIELQESVAEILVCFARGNPGTLLEHVRSLSDAQKSNREPLTLPYHARIESSSTLRALESRFTSTQITALKHIAIGPVLPYNVALEIPDVSEHDLRELVNAGVVRFSQELLNLPNALMRSHLFWGIGSLQRRQMHQLIAEAANSIELKLFHQSRVDDSQIPSRQLIRSAVSLVDAGYIHAAIEVVEWTLTHLDNENPAPELLLFIQQLMRSAHLGIAWRYIKYLDGFNLASDEKLMLLNQEVELRVLEGSTIPTSSIHNAVEEHQANNLALSANLMSMSALALCLDGKLDEAHTDLQHARRLFSEAKSAPGPRFQHAQVLHDSYTGNQASVMSIYQSVIQRKAADVNGITFLTVASALSRLGYHEQARTALLPLLNGTSTEVVYQSLGLLYEAQFAITAHEVPRALRAVERWNASSGVDLMRPLPCIINAWYWIMKDRADKAGPVLDALRPFVIGQLPSIYSTLVTELQGLQALMGARFDEAVTYFQQAQLAHGEIVSIHYVETCVNLIEALSCAHHVQEAANEFRATQSLMARISGRHAKMLILRAQAIALPGDISRARFQALLDMWQPSDGQLELARIHHCFGTRLGTAGRIEQSIEQLAIARTIYRNIGALGWAQRVESQLSSVNASTANTAEDSYFKMLSTDEAQVVAMVRKGMTNKDIAEELFITVSAVEARLTRLFRKTGTRNRQQLSAHFASGSN